MRDGHLSSPHRQDPQTRSTTAVHPLVQHEGGEPLPDHHYCGDRIEISVPRCRAKQELPILLGCSQVACLTSLPQFWWQSGLTCEGKTFLVIITLVTLDTTLPP